MRCDSLFGEQNFLLASFFNLVCFVFKIDVFLPCDKMSQKVLAAIGEMILLIPKSSKEGLDSQWEG
jgi:hypothetical protein